MENQLQVPDSLNISISQAGRFDYSYYDNLCHKRRQKIIGTNHPHYSSLYNDIFSMRVASLFLSASIYRVKQMFSGNIYLI